MRRTWVVAVAVAVALSGAAAAGWQLVHHRALAEVDTLFASLDSNGATATVGSGVCAPWPQRPSEILATSSP